MRPPSIELVVMADQPAVTRMFAGYSGIYDPCSLKFGSYALAGCYGYFLYTGLPEGLLIGRYRTGGAIA